jgi:hypothetical protein
MAFATVDDLALYLQEEVDQAAGVLALNLATARIQRRTLQQFTAITDDVVVLSGGRERIILPQDPVTEISLVRTRWPGEDWVTLVDGVNYIAQGAELTYLDSANPGSHYYLYRLHPPLWPPYVEVTHSHGYAEIPGDVKECCLARAAETLTNPNGLAHERVDDYAYQTSRTKPADAMLRELVATYRRRSSMVWMS